MQLPFSVLYRRGQWHALLLVRAYHRIDSAAGRSMLIIEADVEMASGVGMNASRLP